jgi:hypothetical protein
MKPLWLQTRELNLRRVSGLLFWGCLTEEAYALNADTSSQSEYTSSLGCTTHSQRPSLNETASSIPRQALMNDPASKCPKGCASTSQGSHRPLPVEGSPTQIAETRQPFSALVRLCTRWPGRLSPRPPITRACRVREVRGRLCDQSFYDQIPPRSERISWTEEKTPRAR